jgi:uncharacterized protein (TIGR03067 family)
VIRRAVLFVMAIMLIGADTRREPDLLKTVEASLEGDWRLTYMEGDGGGEMSAEGWTMSFRSDKACLYSKGKLWTEKKFSLDSFHNPPHIDMVFPKEGVVPDYQGRTALGIYKVEGDTLTLRWGWTRPKDFTRNQRSNQPVDVMVRVRR